MLDTPVPTPEEGRANAAFGALMRSMARPGTVEVLPEPGEGSLIAALIDRECRVFCADPLLMPRLLETGARLTDLAEADHVFAGQLRARGDLAGLALGSDLYPDDGATLVLRGTIGAGLRLRLSGPGIDVTSQIALGGLPDGFWRFRAEAARYPMGFELFVLDGAKVVGLPRSTKVEVL